MASDVEMKTLIGEPSNIDRTSRRRLTMLIGGLDNTGKARAASSLREPQSPACSGGESAGRAATQKCWGKT